MVNLPSAETLRAYYEYERNLKHVRPFVLPLLEAVVQAFEKHRVTNQLLEVGFGSGALLRIAEELGWRTHGIDISQSAVQAGRAAGLSADLVEGDFVRYPYPNQSFDVVVFDNIIEHTPDPMPFLRRAREVLRPGGLIYMTVPHGGGISGRLLGARWSIWIPPEHLHMFSLRSAKLAATGAGFPSPRVYTRGFNPYELLQLFRPKAAPPSACQVNEAVTRTAAGRLLKRVVNLGLEAVALGDQLYLEANSA